MSWVGGALRLAGICAALCLVPCASISAAPPQASFNEYSLPSGSQPHRITVGIDGNRWFTESGADAIGRITPNGAIRSFPLPTPSARPDGIALGSDGAIWFTEIDANKIGRITTKGAIREFPIPTAGSQPVDIAAGPDGNLWFTESHANQVGRITLRGAITEFPASGTPDGITAGPGGALWLTEFTGNAIDEMTTAGTIAHRFVIPTGSSLPREILEGGDGRLWFGEAGASKIGRVSSNGTFAEFPIPTPNSNPGGMTIGADGNVYFTEIFGNKVGQITPSGAITEFPLPTPGSGPDGIDLGPVLFLAENDGSKIATFHIPVTPGKCQCAKLTIKLDPTLLNKKIPPHKHDFGVGISWRMTCSEGSGGCKATVYFLPPEVLAGSVPVSRGLKLNIKRLNFVCTGPCNTSKTGRFEIKMHSRDQLNKLFGRTLAFAVTGSCAGPAAKVVNVFIDNTGRLRAHR
jgi:streptogramin lyase